MTTETPVDRATRLAQALDAIHQANRDTQVQQRIRVKTEDRLTRLDAIANVAERLEVLYIKAAQHPTLMGSQEQRWADAILLVDAVEALRHPKDHR